MGICHYPHRCVDTGHHSCETQSTTVQTPLSPRHPLLNVMYCVRVSLWTVKIFLAQPPLKGQCHEIFCFWFFHESVSPQPQSIPLRLFQIFSKIRGDIRKSRCITCINNTGGNFATTPAAKLPPVSTTPVANNGNNYQSADNFK